MALCEHESELSRLAPTRTYRTTCAPARAQPLHQRGRQRRPRVQFGQGAAAGTLPPPALRLADSAFSAGAARRTQRVKEKHSHHGF